MKPTLVIDYGLESLLMHWLVLEKECPIDVKHHRYGDMIKAPYFVDADILIYDHNTLVQFLQERYPGEQLLPADPVSRAQIRQACTLVSDPKVNVMPEIEEILRTGTEYMTGREFTLLDIYIGTWLSEYVLKNEVSAAVANYWKRISNRLAFKVASQ